jgi:hypothetical protein
MNDNTKAFLLAQKQSANNPVGSHQARKRDLAIRLAKADSAQACAIADDIESDLQVASDVSGYHPDACLQLAAWLRDWHKAL